jgi:hypothetical protein
MDGSWSLAMNVIKDDFVLSGQATLTLSNDRTFLYAITGRYNQNQDTAKLRLKGQDEAAKTSLILSTTTTNFVVTSITGSVLGQNLKFDSR